MASDDPHDFTEKYNTKLSAEQEKQFQGFLKSQSEKAGRDLSKDLYDYDMRGDWLAGANRDERGHGSDQFKKPNHPTFSTVSQYSGQDGKVGGQWDRSENGNYSFTPGPANLEHFNAQELSDYFQKVEPGNQLLLPNQ